ncbi:hypothetical protein GGR52DRAFT_534632 [Hypoxylon sp. FL1284]|nr:hypothetical protein GGR52DRAFT_534632 [Hypoxylon sp. FL1284]
MELQSGADDGRQSVVAFTQTQQHHIEAILRSIDEVTQATLESNKAAVQQNAASPDDPSLRSCQSALLRDFKDMMTTVHSNVSKATHEVESQLGPKAHADRSHVVTDSQLNDLVGVDTSSDPNRHLGYVDIRGKQSYKLRDFAAGTDIQLAIDDNDNPGASSLQDNHDSVVVLRPTLRNVWVIQHAYAKISKHKEGLIKQYLAIVRPEAGVSHKFLREYYEDIGLANLPSKKKLGNLLDVARSSYNHETHDLTLILAFMDHDGIVKCVEPVTGDVINIEQSKDSRTYLILPMVEASLKKLYDVYRSVRIATSELRRADKNNPFAVQLRTDQTQAADIMEGLEKQFGSIGGMDLSSSDVSSDKRNTKRRRPLDDVGGDE